MKFSTEGVLILASAKRLADEYKDKEFNYDFPEGLSQVLAHNIVIALTTSDGDNIVLEVEEFDNNQTNAFDKVITQWLELETDDEILLLSYADFTQICDNNGDYKTCTWPIEKLSVKEKGIYKVQIGIEDFRDNFEEIEGYFRLTISIAKTANKEPNHIEDIAD